MALLTIGAKKYGPSFFKKTDAQIIQEKEAEALKAALTDVSFLIDNDTRSRYNLASLSLSDNDVFEANRKFYLIFPLTSQKIFFDEEDPDNLDKLLETNNELRKQLNPKTLFLWDYRKVEGDKNNKVQDNKKNALIPVKLIPINMRFNSTDTAVEFLESHPLLPEVEKGELLTYDKSIIRKYFRLENHPFSQACIKYGNCLILLPQNKKD